MSNYMEAAFAPNEAKYRDQVLSATWGHLYPQEGVRHYGEIIIAVGFNGDLVCVDFTLGKLQSSPWFYGDLETFMCDLACSKQIEYGKVYRFKGSYIRYKNQNHKFTGKLTTITI